METGCFAGLITLPQRFDIREKKTAVVGLSTIRYAKSMNQFPQSTKQQLQRLGIIAVYLFGSQAEGTAGALSDVDVAVLMKNPRLAQGDIRQLYQALYEIFSDHFDVSGFKNLDIVFLQRTNLELAFDIISHGHVVVSLDNALREEFEHRTTMLYADSMALQEWSLATA